MGGLGNSACVARGRLRHFFFELVYAYRAAMGFITVGDATGRGSLDLGGVQTVSEVAARMVTPATYATLTGVSPVRRVHHQAFFCIGVLPGGGPLEGVFIATAWWYLTLECESHPFSSLDLRNADTLYYDVQEGGVMYFEVDWP